MTISSTTICNLALYKVGAERISSLNEANKRARICKDIYALMRNATLRDHPWKFALKRVTLALTGNTPLYKWDYEYQLPSDYLRILSVYPQSTHKIEGDKLLSDESTLKIKYIFREETEDNFDANFIEAFSLRLAAELAYPIVQSNSLKQSLLQEYQLFLQNAKSNSSQEGSPEPIYSDIWLDSRDRGVDYYDEIQHLTE